MKKKKKTMMQKKNKVISTALVLAWASLIQAAGAATNCQFHVSLSPAGSFVAQSSNLEVRGSATRTGNSVSASNVALKLDSLKTGIDLRDEHMKKKYFETDKYPEAVLTHATGKDGTFTGELQLHNVKKPIAGTYVFEGNEFVGNFKTKMSDFSINKAKYMGVGVNDEIDVTIRLAAPAQAASKSSTAP
jgi:polyisoprenoid-binding protein YceI